jgi:hypothetical protein
VTKVRKGPTVPDTLRYRDLASPNSLPTGGSVRRDGPQLTVVRSGVFKVLTLV